MTSLSYMNLSKLILTMMPSFHDLHLEVFKGSGKHGRSYVHIRKKIKVSESFYFESRATNIACRDVTIWRKGLKYHAPTAFITKVSASFWHVQFSNVQTRSIHANIKIHRHRWTLFRKSFQKYTGHDSHLLAPHNTMVEKPMFYFLISLKLVFFNLKVLHNMSQL